MKKSDSFFFLMICMLAVASVTGWNRPMCIAVIANAIVVLINIIRRTKEMVLSAREN